MLELNTQFDTSIKINAITKENDKEVGYLDIPNPSNKSAWGVIRVPYAIIGVDDGPVAFLSAGLHGDEYEGQITLNNIINTLDPSKIKGKIIVLPCINIQGSYEATRLTPSSNQDMNRVFPGKVDGTPAERLAHFITHQFIEPADFVVDIHSGGYSLEFLPCGVIHDSSDSRVRKQRMDALRAFDAPYGLVLEELDGTGMIDTLVESKGKLFLSTEIGGGQRATQQSIQITSNGIMNVLRHLGLLNDQQINLSKKVLYELPEQGFCMAPEDGIFEPFYDLGCAVKKGDAVGQIHRINAPGTKPILLHVNCNGIVFGKRSPAITTLGDTLILIAQEYQR